jgi:CheY-like chemotaxis protein
MERKRILLIDDEVMFTQLLKMNLEQTGRYEVRVENQGGRGLVTAREFQPDLILLDIIMPDVDGGQLAAQIKDDPALRDVPIIYLTAIVSKQETAAHAGVIGGNAFIAKPVNTKEVMACIEAHMAYHP